MKFGFIVKHRTVWPGGMALRSAGCLKIWLSCLAETRTEHVRPDG